MVDPYGVRGEGMDLYEDYFLFNFSMQFLLHVL